MDNKSCHSQEEKHSNIILNKDADGSNQPVYTSLNGSNCAQTPDDKRTFDISRNVLCSFLACAGFAINVSC